MFITLEGGDFTGKSYVANILDEFLSTTALQEAGLKPLHSREPGGTEEGMKIRAEIFELLANDTDVFTLAEKFCEARRLHIEQVIKPHLEQEGALILLDRYLDSTRIYQYLMGGLFEEELLYLEDKYVGDNLPDITFIFYFPENKFFSTLKIRQDYASINSSGRDTTDWDVEPAETHLARQRYHMRLPDIAASYKEDRAFKFVDASQKPTEVVSQILDGLVEWSYYHEHKFPISFDEINRLWNEFKLKPEWVEYDEPWHNQMEDLDLNLR